jgi:hypothetical protein
VVRTVTEWTEILRDLSPQDAAKRIFGDITHYREGGAHEASDREQLGNAMLAFAALAKEG